MLLKLHLIWIFYKKFILASLLLNLVFIFLDIPIAYAIASKFFIFGIILSWLKMKNEKTAFVFYQNLGLSVKFLTGMVCFIDCILLTFFYALIFFFK